MTNVEGAEKLDRFIHKSSDQSMTVGDVPASPHNPGYVRIDGELVGWPARRGTLSTPARRAVIAELCTRCTPVVIDPSERIPPSSVTLTQACRDFGAALWAAVSPTLESVVSALARILRRSP